MAGCISTNPEYKARFELDPVSADQKISGLVLHCGVYDMEKVLNTGFHNSGIYTRAYCGGVPVPETDPEFRREISPIQSALFHNSASRNYFTFYGGIRRHKK